jgi:peptidyl-prolyl cis-trans isomerase C
MMLRLSLLAAAVALVVACKPPAPKDGAEPKDGDQPAETPDAVAEKPASSGTGPIARVNGKEISRDDFDQQMTRTRSRFERAGREIAPALENRLKENLIRKLVDDELIRQKAEAEDIKVSDDEVTAKFEEHKKRFGSDQSFTSFLERTKQTPEDVQRDLQKNLVRDRLFEKLMADQTPTEDDAKKYFEENKEKYKQRESVRASHILFKVAKTAPAEERKAKEAKAKEILALAKAKDAKFDELARAHSDGPTKSRGGDLGLFSRGRMVKEFEDAAFKAKPGAVIGPIETQFGFHVIKVFEKKPERQREYDEVKDSILTSLKARAKSKATREIIANLKTEAKVEILESGVSLDRRRAPLQATDPKKPLIGNKDLAKIQAAAKAAAAKAHAEGAAAQDKATPKPEEK